jgi:hypothetical protein
VVEFMNSMEQPKAWAKMIAATTAIGFALGAAAALVANRYTEHHEDVAPDFTTKDLVFLNNPAAQDRWPRLWLGTPRAGSPPVTIIAAARAAPHRD